MRQAELTVTNKNRPVPAELRSKGLHHARDVNRAYILAALDCKIPAAGEVGEAVGIGRTTIWRVRISAHRERRFRLIVDGISG